MPVNLSGPAAAARLPVNGILLGVAEANIKRVERKDLLVIKLEIIGTVAARARLYHQPILRRAGLRWHATIHPTTG